MAVVVVENGVCFVALRGALIALPPAASAQEQNFRIGTLDRSAN